MRVWNRCAARFGGLVFACALGLAGTASAYETALTAPDAPKELEERLAGASAVMGAQERGLTGSHELLAAAQSDYNTMVQVLYDAGYFSPVVNILLNGREAATIPPLDVPATVSSIQITVKAGPQFKFGTAEIEPVAEGTEIPQSYAAGQTATTGAIRDAATAGVTGWKAVGYPKAAVGEQNITANHVKARLDSHLTMRPGPKLAFGELRLEGETDVREESIRAIAGFPTGEIYDPEKLQKTGTRLRRTGTFSSVSIQEADTPNPDGTLDYTVSMEDMPKRQLSFGAEISSTQGLDVSFIWLHRNVMKRASRLRFEARVRNIGGDEDIDGRIGVRLDQPDALGPDDNMLYLAELERLNRTHYSVTRGMLGLGARRTFSDELYAELSVLFNYSNSDDAFGSNRTFRYLLLPFRTEWDKRDSKVNAKRGYYLDARFMPFAGLAGADSGVQIRADGRGYFPLGERLVVAGRVQIGSVVGAAQQDVSPEFLFFSGGSQTVRGQPYESLGIAVPPAGDIAGGRSFVGASFEMRGMITDKLSLVGFYDFGAVDSGSFIDGNSVTHSGAGLGVRYDLGGLGPIRLDLAVPVDGTTGDGLQFYIGIGQAF